MSGKIHPTAIIEPGAQLGVDVEIGAYAFVGADVTLGDRTRLHHHATVEGFTSLGAGCEVFPYALLGGKTQDLKFKGGRPGLRIGDRNVFREYVSVHLATNDGEFTTIGGETADLNLERDVGELLAEWKRNKPDLLARFDLDKDGQIGEKEWMLARAQARREVRKTHNEIRTQPGTNMLHQPRDGRLFLISNVDADKLEWRYKFWAWLHLSVLIGSVAGTAFIATN